MAKRSSQQRVKSTPLPDNPEVEISFDGYDPADWRNHPEPPGIDDDDDQEDENAPTPRGVVSISGIDPDVDW